MMSCWGPLFGYIAFCGKGYFVLHVDGVRNDDKQF